MRKVIWWTAAIAGLIPYLLMSLVLGAVNRTVAAGEQKWDDFHDWAYPE
jgi:hypothetical protein